LVPRHGEELAEGRARTLVLGELGLVRTRDAAPEVLVGAQVGDADAGFLEETAIPGRAVDDPGERVAEPREVVQRRRPGHAGAVTDRNREGQTSIVRPPGGCRHFAIACSIAPSV